MLDFAFSHILQGFLYIFAAVCNSMFNTHLIGFLSKDINTCKPGDCICQRMVDNIAVAVAFQGLSA
jgi:hypothetical protein